MTVSLEVEAAQAGKHSAQPVYTLGSEPAERERLRRQSDELLPHAHALLSHVDLPPGAHVLDLGCGPSGMLELLAERVGPTGRFIGVDISPLWGYVCDGDTRFLWGGCCASREQTFRQPV
jgi:SAM-dependent methyltransferase